jgi:putative NIF3 family GTP cyclohydrolase 1 type 2
MSVRDLVAFLHEFAPLGLAGEWDNVGSLHRMAEDGEASP